MLVHVPGLQGGEQPEAEGQQEESDDTETLHRLCPTYAQDINSPLRHVRTRIYFTSESHVHSLINVLRSCHLGKLCCTLEPVWKSVFDNIEFESDVYLFQELICFEDLWSNQSCATRFVHHVLAAPSARLPVSQLWIGSPLLIHCF